MIPQPEVQQVDRSLAATFLPIRDQSDVLNGKMDHLPTVRSIAAHRTAAFEAGRAEGVREAAEVVRRTSECIGGVEIEAMEGDNLAVTLCSYFDDGEGEQDENGWTEAATTGCDQTLKAIAEKYDSAIRALSKEPNK